jgi:hypothetical protein
MKRPLETPGRRWKENIKIDLRGELSEFEFSLSRSGLWAVTSSFEHGDIQDFRFTSTSLHGATSHLHTMAFLSSLRDDEFDNLSIRFPRQTLFHGASNLFPKVWHTYHRWNAKGFRGVHGRKEITKNCLLVGIGKKTKSSYRHIIVFHLKVRANFVHT